jgi:hypothetical protein
MITEQEIRQSALIQSGEDFLAHAGVKGMKWGIRRKRRLEVLERASKKGGPVISKVRAASNLGPIDLVKGRGITGGAKRKFARLAKRNTSIRNGQASVSDKLKYYGSTRFSDLIPVKGKNVNKKSSVKRDYVVVGAAGAVFAANLIARSRRGL